MAANLLCQHLTCQTLFYFSSSYNINVKFKTLQKDLVSISINPLFRDKKKKRKEERRKERKKKRLKKSENETDLYPG